MFSGWAGLPSAGGSRFPGSTRAGLQEAITTMPSSVLRTLLSSAGQAILHPLRLIFFSVVFSVLVEKREDSFFKPFFSLFLLCLMEHVAQALDAWLNEKAIVTSFSPIISARAVFIIHVSFISSTVNYMVRILRTPVFLPRLVIVRKWSWWSLQRAEETCSI